MYQKALKERQINLWIPKYNVPFNLLNLGSLASATLSAAQTGVAPTNLPKTSASTAPAVPAYTPPAAESIVNQAIHVTSRAAPPILSGTGNAIQNTQEILDQTSQVQAQTAAITAINNLNAGLTGGSSAGSPFNPNPSVPDALSTTAAVVSDALNNTITGIENQISPFIPPFTRLATDIFNTQTPNTSGAGQSSQSTIGSATTISDPRTLASTTLAQLLAQSLTNVQKHPILATAGAIGAGLAAGAVLTHHKKKHARVKRHLVRRKSHRIYSRRR